MSRIATDWAWRQELSTSTQKLLLLSFADRADEDHCCWPSIARLVKDTGLNEKTVGSNIKKLETLGLIKDTGKRKGSTGKVKVYRIIGIEEGEKPNTSKSGGIGNSTPVEAHINQGVQQGVKANTPKSGCIANSNTPNNGSVNTPEIGSLNTPENGSQNQSLEPPKEPLKNKSKNSLDYSIWPEQPSEQVRKDWEASRKANKVPVTQTIIAYYKKQITIATEQGLTVDECLSEWVVRGWQRFKYEWVSPELKELGLQRLREKQSGHQSSFAASGVISEYSTRKEVGEAMVAGYQFSSLPQNHKDDLLKEWRAGRLRIDLINALERQNIAL
ncbi:helix-turn-helix domain-containing protein [Pseudoalteromonas luteoviolacea]|uniref:helix-turn-helix domain-containing protein n=1 Tax=Pseudoalteromonas luteoviolacea TaxID=43657 RepID=UPI001F1E8F6B|nr:helix-turn-helix domain-containing protein [Pseudoalteromonas luteoviolacea]MCF6442047.1 helix-turn-helix domain-containing protein [Pseudoalteromonas luteoviolacea]